MFAAFRPIRPYLARYKAQFTVGFVCLVIGQSVGALVPLAIKAGVDDLMHGVALRRLAIVAGVLIGLSLIKAVFQFWTRWILIGISRDAEYDLRNDLFRHLLRLSPRYYAEHRTGDLMSKLTNDLNAVRNMIGPGIMYSATTLVVGITTITLMLRLDWKLTLMALTPMPLVSVGVKYFGAKIHERF
ncbi:MAG TPA: ABC transporter transmembrane domain-containing protein, partial [Terriglobia bacterium]|nr:ABC transporter transmembrane domain-containing protein [Terriglobia bacterium]